MRYPISVFIITKNEEARIKKTIEAVKDWVHEVIVVDSGSTDKTVEIAASLGAKIFHQDWLGYGQQKRFGEDQCSQKWLLNVDADEVVSTDLQQEISALFSTSELEPCAYRIKIHYIYPGDEKPRPFANDYNVVRLYHINTGRYSDHPAHDRVDLHTGAKVKSLTHTLYHYAFLDWSHLLEKVNSGSRYNLEKLAKKPKSVLILRIFCGFPLNFLRIYLFRRHIFGGWKGFIFALSTTLSRTMRIVRALARK